MLRKNGAIIERWRYPVKFLLSPLFAAAGLLLLLCSTSIAADETIDVLTIADPTGDWGFPSPYGHYSRGPGYVRMSMIFDTLVWKDQNGYVPALAESWQLEDDAYVFNLRKNVSWHDGDPFTAKDVVFTINYISGIFSSSLVAIRIIKIRITIFVGCNLVLNHFDRYWAIIPTFHTPPIFWLQSTVC